MPADVEVTAIQSKYPSRGFFRRFYDLVRAAFQQADVYHITGDIHFLALLLPRKKTILTIHDCRSLDRLSGVRYWVYWLFWYWLPIRCCCLVTVISESTKQALARHVSIEGRNVKVIPDCVSSDFQYSDYEFQENNPRILQVGTNDNKNLFRVIEALSGFSCTLVIIGPLSPVHIALLRKEGVAYENFTALRTEQITEQYNKCDLVIFVSTYEGFGLPILEAQAVGRPLLTSDISPMRDVAGGGAILVDPLDVANIRGGLTALISDSRIRKRIVDEGTVNVSQYSASEIAEKYCIEYRTIAKGRI